MRYRVDELAAHCGVSVDTVRFYQAKGLMTPGLREGRVSWYSEEHRQRLARIRDLKEKGFSLATIRRLLAGELDAADEALASALASAMPGDDTDGDQGPEELLTLEEFAKRTGIPEALIQVIERQGLLVAPPGVGPRYTSADVRAASAGIALLEAGLPLDELLALAKEHRAPIREEARSDAEAAERLVEAFRTLLPATTRLVAHHFQRVLLATAQARFEGPAIPEEAP